MWSSGTPRFPRLGATVAHKKQGLGNPQVLTILMTSAVSLSWDSHTVALTKNLNSVVCIWGSRVHSNSVIPPEHEVLMRGK